MSDSRKGYRLHECESMPKQGVQVIFSAGYVVGRKAAWCLSIRREATESDLEENQYLEQEGDLIWTTAIEVSHCPYCGISLYKKDEKREEDFGKFTHTDFSGWSSKIQ